ncbi:MAG: hypothetical protein IPK16_16060 [Anaerolineales bacterium]|nr:hypothetical protein [Anaerolineales bacterium]
MSPPSMSTPITSRNASRTLSSIGATGGLGANCAPGSGILVAVIGGGSALCGTAPGELSGFATGGTLLCVGWGCTEFRGGLAELVIVASSSAELLLHGTSTTPQHSKA